MIRHEWAGVEKRRKHVISNKMLLENFSASIID